MELLSYPRITVTEENNIIKFLSYLNNVELSRDIENTTINFRRQHNCKLQDAIIVASSIVMQAVLVTSDIQLLSVRFPGYQSLKPM